MLHIMKNPNKYLKGYQNLKSIFGLFDEITAQIVARDSWKLIAFECSYGIILPFHYWLLLRTQQCMLEDEDISSFLMFGLLGVCIFSILSWLKYQINRLENEIQLTSRQTLLHLVYNQLIICDVYFLQNADNNVIHKLLYSEFEDFIEYPRNFVSLTSIILVFVFTAVFRIYSFGHSDWVLGVVVLFLTFFMATMEYLKHIHYARYMITNFEQRKNLYEFIKNFKSLTLRNLNRRYEGIANFLLAIKNKAIYWVRFLDTMDNFAMEICRVGLILLIMINAKTDAQYIRSLMEMASQLIFFYEIIHPIQRFTQGIRRFAHFRSARQVLNRFFDSDLQKPLSTSASSSQSNSASGDDVPLGGVLLQNMSILDRDNKDIAKVIHELLSRRSEKKFKSQNEELKRAQTMATVQGDKNTFSSKKVEGISGATGMNKLFDLKGSLLSPVSDSNNLTSIIGIKVPLKLGQEPSSLPNHEGSALHAVGNTSSPVLLQLPPRSVSSPPVGILSGLALDGLPPKSPQGSEQRPWLDMSPNARKNGSPSNHPQRSEKYNDDDQESRANLRPNTNKSLQEFAGLPNASAIGSSFKDLQQLLQPVPVTPVSDLSRSFSRKTSMIDGLVRAFRRQQSATEQPAAYRLKLLISGLNLKIAPNTRTCVIDKGTHRLSQCLMNCIIGESHNLDGGLRIIRGKLSIYSPDRGIFLAGRTIRDNIVFGEDYSPDRYTEVLRFLGIHLASYCGQDLYQVSEGGGNLKREDLRLILLARFLYREAHIYLIEANSGTFGKALNFTQMKALLYRLRAKTVIYTAGSPDAARLSDQVLLFGRDGRSRCFATARYLSSVARVSMNASMQDSCSQNLDGSLPAALIRPPFGGSVASTVFLEHLQHTEELKIHHERQERKQVIQKMIEARTNVVELIAYGVYLTQKRRKEGVTLMDSPEMNLTDFLQLIKKIYTATSKSVIAGVVISFASISLMVVGEALIFFPVSFFNDDVFSDRLNFPLMLLSTGLLIRFARLYCYLKNVDFNSDVMNREILSSMIRTSIEQVISQRSHRLLDKVNKDLIATELKFHTIYSKILVKLLDIVTASVVLSYVYGGFGPILVLGLTCLSNYHIYKQFLPVYLKVWSLMSWIDYRQGDLNFQILDLIAAYRPINQLHKLTHSVKVVSDSVMKVKYSLSQLQKFTDKMIIPINIFGAMLLVLMQIFGFSSIQTYGFVVKDRKGLAWASIMIFQILLASLTLREQFTALIDLSLHLYRIIEFKEKGRASRQKRGLSRNQLTGYSPTQEIRLVREMEIRQNSPNSGINYESPIIFKNVSYTQGQTPVLRKISLTIEPGERFGLLGLPGSGRSLIFELVTGVMRRDKSQKSKIEVFGVPIEELNEEIIKDNFFLLEQNPVLIEGSVRENIDPYGQFTDLLIQELMIELNVQTILKRDVLGTSRNLDLTSYYTNRASLFYPTADNTGRPRDRLHSISPLQDLAEVYTPNRDRRFVVDSTTPVSVSPSYGMNQLHVSSPQTPTKPGRFSEINIAMQTAPVGKQDFPSETRKARVIIQKMESLRDEEPAASVSKKRLALRTEEFGNSSMRQAGLASLKDLLHTNPVEIHITKPERDAEQLGASDVSNLQDSIGSNRTVKKSGNLHKKGIFLFKSGVASDVRPTFDFEPVSQKEARSGIESEKGSALNLVSPPQEVSVRPDSVHDLRFALAVENMDSMATPNGKQGPFPDSNYIRPEPFIHHQKRHSEELSSMADHNEKFSAINRSDIEHADQKPTSNRFLQIPNTVSRDVSPHSEEHFPKISWKADPPSNPFPQIQTSPEQDARRLLELTAAFEGRNLDVYCRRFIVFCRTILSAPRVLLIQEDALDFGKGIRWNLQKLESKLPSSTIVCLVNSTGLVPLFEKIALLDAGKILESGSKDHLLAKNTSFTYRFLKQIDPDGLRQLTQRRNLNNSTMTHTILLEDDSNEEESLDNDKVIEDHDQNVEEERRDRRNEPSVRLLPVQELEKGMSLSNNSLSPTGRKGSGTEEDFVPLPSLPAPPEELKLPLEDLSKRRPISSYHQLHHMPSVITVHGIPKSNFGGGMAKANKFKSKF